MPFNSPIHYDSICNCILFCFCTVTNLPKSKTRSIWKMLGPFATASRRTPIHHVSLLSHASTVTRRLHVDVHDNDNAWQRGPLWPIQSTWSSLIARTRYNASHCIDSASLAFLEMIIMPRLGFGFDCCFAKSPPEPVRRSLALV